MYKIAVTNRNMCTNLIDRIACLSDYEYIILREKDLSEEDYYNLAKKAVAISNRIILHTFIDTAYRLDYKKIHLPYSVFKENIKRLKEFDIVGVSTHSVEEAVNCEKMGADYITSSHIFRTDCKKGLEPKGLVFLEKVCQSVNIPVYALGGINNSNSELCIKAGARGVCMMSQAMKSDI